ncbi:MAG: SIMPL domain-containing protein [Dermatophilaceae bacterium]
MPDRVDVVGTGSASAVPDIVVVDARVQVDAGDVASALADAAARVTAALQVAADHGVAGTDRRTTGIGTSPRWDGDGRAIAGYTAHQTVRLTIRDRDHTGAVLAAVAEAAGDAFGVDTLSLQITDRSPLMTRAREAAFADARATAEQLARLADRTLGPVLRVTEQPGTDHPMAALRTMSTEAMDGMPLAAGESTVTATVAVRFGLGPA